MAFTYSLPPFCQWDFTVTHTSDWWDPLPQLKNSDGTPLDLTATVVQIFVRVRYGHETLIAFLTSVGDAGITIDDAEEGLATVHVDQADVADFPVGQWEWFMRLVHVSGIREVARGQFYVLPGDDTHP